MDKNYAEKMQRFREYIEALEEERRKIQVFRSELPLCLELVTQTIDTWRKQVSGTTMEFCLGQSECSEQISSEGPVLEELFPIKKTSSCNDGEQQSHKPVNNSSNLNKDNKTNDKLSTKSDWLRSVQLWNQTPDQPIKEDTPRKVSVMEVKGNGCGAFHPFKREKIGGSPSLVAPAATASSTAETGDSSGGGGSKIDQKGGQSSQRKERRCWSPELHRRFLHALQQLGGSHVATPKQIRELMKVDGLTNDEVKSHLQKYRLHTRRPSSSNQNNNPQAPQFVVVGGIWVPPPAVAAATTASASASGEAPGSVATSSGIYAPIAAPPPPPPPQCLPQAPEQSKQLHSDDRSSHSEGRAHSNSPSTSSSTHTHTTTASSVLVPVV